VGDREVSGSVVETAEAPVVDRAWFLPQPGRHVWCSQKKDVEGSMDFMKSPFVGRQVSRVRTLCSRPARAAGCSL
jgi:hypothetical protein